MRDGKKEKTREIIEQVYYDIMCLFYEGKKNRCSMTRKFTT